MGITCPGLQLLPSAKAHGMRSDISRGCAATEAHPREQLCSDLSLGHTGNSWTHTEPRGSHSMGTPASCIPRALDGSTFGKGSVQDPVLKSLPQEGSQRWQIRGVYVGVIP